MTTSPTKLVEWFNQVDFAYRTELRELNDINFARFDAKLEQRIAEVKAELRQELAEVRTELRTGLPGVEGRLLARMGVVEGRFGTLQGHLVRWMFLFWAASVGTSIALIELAR